MYIYIYMCVFIKNSGWLGATLDIRFSIHSSAACRTYPGFTF